MNLSSLLLGIWLVLVGIDRMDWADLSLKFLGVWAFVTGVVWLIEAYHPLKVPRP